MKFQLFFWHLLFILGGCLWPGSSHPQTPETVFRVYSPVTDNAALLTESERATLEEKLLTFEKETGAQLVLVTVATTGALSIEEFAHELFTHNKFGRQGVDDGVLLLIARDDRRMRLEVGYGLEGTLPDALAARIIHNILTPHFKEGRFYEGINEAMSAIMNVIRGNMPEKLKVDYTTTSKQLSSSLDNILLWFIILVIVGNVVTSVSQHWFIRLIFFIIVYLLLLYITVSWFISLILLVLLYLFSIFTKGRTTSSPWIYHTSADGSSWSSSDSSTSFNWSGGGGDSGGGGASGSW